MMGTHPSASLLCVMRDLLLAFVCVNETRRRGVKQRSKALVRA